MPRQQMPIFLRLFPLTKHRGINAFLGPLAVMTNLLMLGWRFRVRQMSSHWSKCVILCMCDDQEWVWSTTGTGTTGTPDIRSWCHTLITVTHFLAPSLHVSGFLSDNPKVFSPIPAILFSHCLSCIGSDFSNNIFTTEQELLVGYIASSPISAYPNFNSQMLFFHNDVIEDEWKTESTYHQLQKCHQSDSKPKPTS